MFVLLYRIADRIRQRGRARAWEATRALGRRGEDIAHRYLQREGMTVVARNYRTATGAGEIDLVAWHGDTLVFVEVKTRASAEFGPPDRAVGSMKRETMVRAAADYARRSGVEWDKVRFDVVNVITTTPPAVTHFPAAFSARILARESREAS